VTTVKFNRKYAHTSGPVKVSNYRETHGQLYPRPLDVSSLSSWVDQETSDMKRFTDDIDKANKLKIFNNKAHLSLNMALGTGASPYSTTHSSLEYPTGTRVERPPRLVFSLDTVVPVTWPDVVGYAFGTSGRACARMRAAIPAVAKKEKKAEKKKIEVVPEKKMEEKNTKKKSETAEVLAKFAAEQLAKATATAAAAAAAERLKASEAAAAEAAAAKAAAAETVQAIVPVAAVAIVAEPAAAAAAPKKRKMAPTKSVRSESKPVETGGGVGFVQMSPAALERRIEEEAEKKTELRMKAFIEQSKELAAMIPVMKALIDAISTSGVKRKAAQPVVNSSDESDDEEAVAAAAEKKRRRQSKERSRLTISEVRQRDAAAAAAFEARRKRLTPGGGLTGRVGDSVKPKEILALQSLDVEVPRKMNHAEKHRIADKISLMKGDEIRTVVQIVNERIPNFFSAEKGDEIVFDMDELDDATFRHLERFCNQVLVRRQKAIGGGSVCNSASDIQRPMTSSANEVNWSNLENVPPVSQNLFIDAPQQKVVAPEAAIGVAPLVPDSDDEEEAPAAAAPAVAAPVTSMYDEYLQVEAAENAKKAAEAEEKAAEFARLHFQQRDLLLSEERKKREEVAKREKMRSDDMARLKSLEMQPAFDLSAHQRMMAMFEPK